ncbi:MAG: hypothetical protein Crog4KO_28950 [Crocinitomicaceae bacterium]
MKTLILFISLFIANVASAQTFNDTIFFNSGEERIVHVTKETNNAISYQYKNQYGRLKSGRSRKSMLFGYAIYDENEVLVNRFEKPHKKLTSEDRKTESNKVGPGVGVGIVGAGVMVGTGVVVGTGLIIVAVWNSIFG